MLLKLIILLILTGEPCDIIASELIVVEDSGQMQMAWKMKILRLMLSHGSTKYQRIQCS